MTLPCKAEEAFAAFAALSDEMAGLPEQLRELEESGEPYRPEQLPVSDEELASAGADEYRRLKLRRALLGMVIEHPELCRKELLLSAAEGLCKERRLFEKNPDIELSELSY